jgi:hypothetical protein
MENNIILIIISTLFIAFLLYLVITRKSTFDRLNETEKIAHQTDAKRFANLLIGEIKLFEHERLQRGIKNKNVYQMLKYKIEDARKDFKKRIIYSELEQYFDEAVLELLADGDRSILGQEY